MKERVRKLNSHSERGDAEYVLYWSQANRRAESNHALAFAADLANRLGLPVLCYEALTSFYPLANDRIHTFVLEGVAANERRFDELGIGYVFYLRRTKSDPNDVLYHLAQNAAAVVTDDYPTSLTAVHNARVPCRLDIPCYAVDSSCIVPMSRMTKREYAAYTIRPKIRKMLPDYMKPVPAIKVRRRFTGVASEYHMRVELSKIPQLVSSCDIDHSVRPSLSFRGGRDEALRRLEHFLEHNLRRYDRHRNEPSAHATSNLSPHLRFGYVSSLEIALAVGSYARAHELSPDGFLEELIVRRELAFNFARFSKDPQSLENLPGWAMRTLRKHAHDKRSPSYNREQFENALTHDDLWNATQKEMLLRGKIHGYYRMYWGKKIIEWSASHQDALETMIYIHDRYALDGRDPNTYTNILWCFGLHDRPWQERPIFGQVRYMSRDGMKRKTGVDAYIREIDDLERTGKDPYRIQ